MISKQEMEVILTQINYIIKGLEKRITDLEEKLKEQEPKPRGRPKSVNKSGDNNG